MLVNSEGTDQLSAAAGLDLPRLCEQIASRGMWPLCCELTPVRSTDAAAMAFELLATLEPNRERPRLVQIALGDALPWHLRRGALNDPLPKSAPTRTLRHNPPCPR